MNNARKERDGGVRTQIGQHDVAAIDVLGGGGHGSVATLPDAVVDRLGDEISVTQAAVGPPVGHRRPVSHGSGGKVAFRPDVGGRPNQRIANSRGDRLEHVEPRRIHRPNDDQHRQQRRHQRARPWATAARKCRPGRGRSGRMSAGVLFMATHARASTAATTATAPACFNTQAASLHVADGCKNIIYQEDTRALHPAAAPGRDLKCPADVASPILRR